MKLVITVIGADKVGIIAGVTRVLAENRVNITTINQTIVEGIFNMIMVGEPEDGQLEIATLQDALREIELSSGVTIKVQRMDIFRAMHEIQ